jgi:hypothetical protein
MQYLPTSTVYFIVILPSPLLPPPQISKVVFSLLILLRKSFMAFHLSPLHATYPIHFVVLDLMMLTEFQLTTNSVLFIFWGGEGENGACPIAE